MDRIWVSIRINTPFRVRVTHSGRCWFWATVRFSVSVMARARLSIRVSAMVQVRARVRFRVKSRSSVMVRAMARIMVRFRVMVCVRLSGRGTVRFRGKDWVIGWEWERSV